MAQAALRPGRSFRRAAPFLQSGRSWARRQMAESGGKRSFSAEWSGNLCLPDNDRLSEGLTALHPPVGMCRQGGRSADTPHVLRRSFASLAPIFDQPPVCVSHNHEGWSYSLSELIMAATEEQGHLTPPLRQHALPILLDAANLAKPPCVTR
jgi:hypothetical protein